jgi:hypothetical protein
MSPTPIRTETDCPCPCGKPGCFQGVLTSDDGYIKRSWKPKEQLFSSGTRYLLIQVWDAIKAHRKWVELQDKKGHISYRITMEDAAKYGEWWVAPPTFAHNRTIFRVPTQYWTATHGAV